MSCLVRPFRALGFERSLRRVALALCVFTAALSASKASFAFPWMVRHGYRQCQQCHVDPGGSGILTAYGRALGEIVLTMPRGEPTGEETSASEFLWGIAPLPSEVLLGGDLRLMRLAQKVEDVELRTRLIYMQLDAEAALTLERFVASATLGYAPEGALDAAVTRGTEKNLVSRQHWLGYVPIPGTMLVRAGRMNLPYGVRSIEHTLWARALTRTSIDDDQQYGLSVSLEGSGLRGEVMGILGNFQTRPADFRERGYSGYLEWMPNDQLALGATSLITHRDLDPARLRPAYRHAHGIMARWHTPWDPLVVLTEWDYLLETPKGAPRRSGVVGYAQADFEPFRGVHFLLTLEGNDYGVEGTPWSYGAWLSYAWFFLPHVDLRLDSVYHAMRSPVGRRDVVTWLAQMHVYL
jgi:hypothetical protein